MFPLRDTIRSKSFPVMNWILILANLLAFLFEISLGRGTFNQLIFTFGLVPIRLSILKPLSYITILTSMFMHAGWFHFLSNMWTLFIFGDNVEDRMGSFRYLFFYLASGTAAGLIQVIFSSNSSIPTVGASGAIAGVLGAYFLLFPTARIVTFIPIFFLPWLVEIPALFYLGFWFISQLFSGFASLGASLAAAVGGVAWWAHIGGFIFGLSISRSFINSRRTNYSFSTKNNGFY